MKEGGLRKVAGVLFRTAVSVGLIIYVFVHLIDYQDTVRLADGSERRGRVVEVASDGVRMRTEAGEEVFVRDEALLPEDRGAPVHYGFLSVVARSDPTLLATGLGAFVFINLIAYYRLWLLLCSQGLVLPRFDVLRWHFIGLFYNTFLPGLTGGDLVKAYYIMRRTQGKRTAAVVTILVDRVIGIVALALIAGAVLAFRLGDDRLREAAVVIYSFLGAVAAGTCVFFSRRIRRLFRVDRILEILPFSGIVKRIDDAVFLFRYRKQAVATAMGLSFVSHSITILVNFAFGLALGLDEIGVAHYFVFVPTILILTSLPISLGGIGWGEAMYLHFFEAVAPAAGTDVGNRAVALSLVFRIAQILWSLLGGVFLLRGERRVSEEEMRQVVG